jgi:hypothetical protein
MSEASCPTGVEIEKMPGRRRVKALFLCGLLTVCLPVHLASPASAAPIVSCAGAALVGGAQLLCSHTDPRGTAQLCTYSWSLATMSNATQVVSGTFLLPPGSNNVTVYQGSGFSHAMSNPIVMCQGKRKQKPPQFQ